MSETTALEPSAVEALIDSSYDLASPHPPHLQALAQEVAHNLRHQHDWTAVRVHTHSPRTTEEPLSRPLVSGVPPRRVYIHPDEQIELIKAGIKDENLPPEREWVLPSHLSEKWSLRRFAEVFDAIDAMPPSEEAPGDAVGAGEAAAAGEASKWRKLKRVLLATADSDSTITYYIVHDGIVKPRQN